MTADEWNTIALLLDKGFKWREPFGEAHETTYRILLDGYSAEDVASAIRALVARGQVFGPTPGEVVAEIRNDPAAPTFDEAYALIYRPKGILWGKSNAQSTEFAKSRVHPLVGSFALRYGIERLRMLEVDHEDYGDIKRRDLRLAWDQHVEAMEGRDVAALVASSDRRGQLGRFDPLTALGSPAPQIEQESAA